jgi:CheY-like chemotaxis protein
MTTSKDGTSKSTEFIHALISAANDRGLGLPGQDGCLNRSRLTEMPEPECLWSAGLTVAGEGFHQPQGVDRTEASLSSQLLERTHVRARRVLLLEDDKALRDVLTEVLTGEGYQVETCRTFGELYRTASELRGDIALADFWGPSLSELADAERDEITQLSRVIPVILMTARPWADAMSAEQLGTRALLHKPFELDELLASIIAASVEA